jgi:rare lipoprotein A
MRFQPLFIGLPRISIVVATLHLLLFFSACAHRKKISVPPGVIPSVVHIGDSEEGVASWYGDPYHGRRAANGDIYDMNELTAAHRTWPFDTLVRVTNLENRREVEVRITDRGPFVKGRIIDLSRAAAEQIAMIGPGTAHVKLRVVATGVVALPRMRYAVQAGAFASRENAEREMRNMESRFGMARIERGAGEKRLWRVLVGETRTRAEAEELATRVRRVVRGAVVVTIDNADHSE